MSVDFATYSGNILTIDLKKLEYAMYSESKTLAQYDYIDPESQLSFQKIDRNHLFIADPAFSITKSILKDRWVITYDSGFTGYSNVKFVAANVDATNSNNWKDINDVLAIYQYEGVLPIQSFQDVYIQVVYLTDLIFTTNTIYTPQQPYLCLAYVNTSDTFDQIPYNEQTKVPYNRLIQAIGVDAGSFWFFALSGNNAGQITLTTPGRFLVDVNFDGILLGVPSLTTSYEVQVIITLNGNIKKKGYGSIRGGGIANLANAETTTLITVSDTDLSPNQSAVLEVDALHFFPNGPLTLTSFASNTAYQQVRITFLG